MSGQHPDATALDPGGDSIAVNFDFVEPGVALGRMVYELGELRGNEIGERVRGAAGHWG
jgi:hypothetical protein